MLFASSVVARNVKYLVKICSNSLGKVVSPHGDLRKLRRRSEFRFRLRLLREISISCEFRVIPRNATPEKLEIQHRNGIIIKINQIGII